MLEELTEQAKLAVEQVLDAAKLERGGLFVVGCSSSEVCGSKIGTNSSRRRLFLPASTPC